MPILPTFSRVARSVWASPAGRETVGFLVSLLLVGGLIYGVRAHILADQQREEVIRAAHGQQEIKDAQDSLTREALDHALARGDSLAAIVKDHAVVAVAKYHTLRDTLVITDTTAVRHVLAAADTAIDSLSTALVASEAARDTAQHLIVAQGLTITRVTAERDSMTKAALTGRYDTPPRTGWTVGPSVGLGQCVTKTGYGTCAHVGISLTWGVRLGKR